MAPQSLAPSLAWMATINQTGLPASTPCPHLDLCSLHPAGRVILSAPLPHLSVASCCLQDRASPLGMASLASSLCYRALSCQFRKPVSVSPSLEPSHRLHLHACVYIPHPSWLMHMPSSELSSNITSKGRPPGHSHPQAILATSSIVDTIVLTGFVLNLWSLSSDVSLNDVPLASYLSLIPLFLCSPKHLISCHFTFHTSKCLSPQPMILFPSTSDCCFFSYRNCPRVLSQRLLTQLCLSALPSLLVRC